MSEDEKRRKKERDAKLGDPVAAAAVHRDQRRLGEGLVSFLDELVGKRVYVEGVRINLRGTARTGPHAPATARRPA